MKEDMIKEIKKIHQIIGIKWNDSKINNILQFSEKILSIRLSIIILWLLKNRSMHGYDIIKILKEDGTRCATASRVYPILRKMMQHGLVTQKKEMHGKRTKKVYSITDTGKKILDSVKRIMCASKLRRQFILEMVK